MVLVLATAGFVALPIGRYLLRGAWEEGKILAGRRHITAVIEDSVVNAARVVEWFRTAGVLCGLCDWRPRFGRFQAASL